MSKQKRCEICGVDPAAVPDRDKPWSQTKRVCLACHAARLRGDLDHIMEVRRKRREALRHADDDTLRELRVGVADMALQRNYWHREAERLRSALAAAPAPRGIPDPAYSDWYYITRTPALTQQRPKP